MGIKHCGDGTFKVNYSKRHPHTRQPVSRVRIGIKGKAEANRIYAALVVEVNDKIKRKMVPQWDAHLESYFSHLKESGLSNSTIYNREKVVRCHTLPDWQTKLVDEISTAEIHRLLQEKLGSNSEAHRKFFIKGIRGAFKYAYEKGLVNRDPTPLLKFKISEKIKSGLNEEQILILLRKAQEFDWPWYPHYAVALFTGMRNGEIYALSWANVNLELRQIIVNCSWSSKDGFKSTKSGDDRVVEIPKPLIPVLMDLKLKSGGSDFVLPRLCKWDKGEQARELRLFMRANGLPEIRFHDLRASWATLLLGKGVAPSKVMSMGGWKDMDTMMIYMRKAGINIRDSTRVLDDMHTHGIQKAKVISLKE